MVEKSDDRRLELQESPRNDLGATVEISQSYAAHLKFIGNVRKFVPAVAIVCGVGAVACVRAHEHFKQISAQQPDNWELAAKILLVGVLACLAATLALVVEYVARPAPTRFTLRALSIRFLLVLLAVVAVGVGMYFGYGAAQGIAGAIGIFLALAAVRERGMVRVVLAILAAMVIGPTLLSTQSTYQYARWHAGEIVAAGSKLMEQCPATGFRIYNPHPDNTSGTSDLFGKEVQPNDPRVPPILRKLGARRIWVDKERVAVYVGRLAFSSVLPRPEVEFQIFSRPSQYTSSPVWGSHGKGATRITDRLWTNDY